MSRSRFQIRGWISREPELESWGETGESEEFKRERAIKQAYLKCHKTEQFIGNAARFGIGNPQSSALNPRASILGTTDPPWLQSKLISVCIFFQVSVVSGLRSLVFRIETCRCGARLLWNSNFMKLIKYKFVVRDSPTGTQRPRSTDRETEKERLRCIRHPNKII